MFDERGWRPFSEITRAGLRQAALRLKLALAADVEAALMAQYQALAPYAENAEVLRALCARGVRCGILSNGDRAMLEPLLRHCRFAALIHPLLCAETVRRFKTDSAVYDLGPRALGLRAEEILFVSSNGWDAIGATWYGYTTLWVNRSDAPLESLDTSPTRIGRSLRDVLDLGLYFGLSPWVSMPIAALAGFAVALLMGLATLRLRGAYTVVVTLAIAMVMYQLIVTDVECFRKTATACYWLTGGRGG